MQCDELIKYYKCDRPCPLQVIPICPRTRGYHMYGVLPASLCVPSLNCALDTAYVRSFSVSVYMDFIMLFMKKKVIRIPLGGAHIPDISFAELAKNTAYYILMEKEGEENADKPI